MGGIGVFADESGGQGGRSECCALTLAFHDQDDDIDAKHRSGLRARGPFGLSKRGRVDNAARLLGIVGIGRNNCNPDVFPQVMGLSPFMPRGAIARIGAFFDKRPSLSVCLRKRPCLLKRGMRVYVEKAVFAKHLQEYEGEVYWASGLGAPHGVVVHEWRLISNDRLILKELDAADRSLYWIDDGILR